MKRIIISALIMMFAVGSFASDNKKNDSKNDTSTTTVGVENQEAVPTPAPMEEEVTEYPSSGDQTMEDMGTDTSSSDDDDW